MLADRIALNANETIGHSLLYLTEQVPILSIQPYFLTQHQL
ncbi:hypothetical protein D030_5347 [Vibrio parahaemolyticus AQ3810]|nr:hypothetical protein D030_5347 [Vibrio parahaemolyticus AQ3810]